MISVTLFYLIAVFFSARRTQALHLYADSSLEPQAELIQKLVTEVEDGTNMGERAQREKNELYPLLLQHDSGRDPWNKVQESAKEEKYDNMVEDLKEIILKMAAADKLRAQGFIRSEQSLPKASKRACFWKYCVTN